MSLHYELQRVFLPERGLQPRIVLSNDTRLKQAPNLISDFAMTNECAQSSQRIRRTHNPVQTNDILHLSKLQQALTLLFSSLFVPTVLRIHVTIFGCASLRRRLCRRGSFCRRASLRCTAAGRTAMDVDRRGKAAGSNRWQLKKIATQTHEEPAEKTVQVTSTLRSGAFDLGKAIRAQHGDFINTDLFLATKTFFQSLQ